MRIALYTSRFGRCTHSSVLGVAHSSAFGRCTLVRFWALPTNPLWALHTLVWFGRCTLVRFGRCTLVRFWALPTNPLWALRINPRSTNSKGEAQVKHRKVEVVGLKFFLPTPCNF